MPDVVRAGRIPFVPDIWMLVTIYPAVRRNVAMSGRPVWTRRKAVRAAGALAGVGLAGASGCLGRDGTGSPGGPTESASPTAAAHGDEDPTVAAPEGWRQFQADATKAGVAQSGPGSSAGVAWSYTVGGRGADWADGERRYGRPVVGDDGAVYAPTTDGFVSVAGDGSHRWSLTVDLAKQFLYSTAAVADGTVYVGADVLGDDFDDEPVQRNALVALDAADGARRWETPTEGNRMSTPTVAGDRVFCVSPGGTSYSGRLYAFDSASGEVAWTRDLGTTDIRGATTGPVAVADGVVYVPASDLLALDAATGEPVWTADHVSNLKGPQHTAPAVVGDTVYVGTGGEGAAFYAVALDDGAEVWTFQATRKNGSAANGGFTAAAVADGRVHVGYEGVDDSPAGYYALDAADGTAEWFQSAASVAAPAVADGTVYAGATALSASEGIVRWSQDLPGAGAPAVVDGRLYVGGTSIAAVADDADG